MVVFGTLSEQNTCQNAYKYDLQCQSVCQAFCKIGKHFQNTLKHTVCQAYRTGTNGCVSGLDFGDIECLKDTCYHHWESEACLNLTSLNITWRLMRLMLRQNNITGDKCLFIRLEYLQLSESAVPIRAESTQPNWSATTATTWGGFCCGAPWSLQCCCCLRSPRLLAEKLARPN